MFYVYKSEHFKGANDVTLFYRSWIPQHPRALLVLVHGAGEHSGRYVQIGEACMGDNIALVAPDLRGFGQSEGRRGHVDHFTDYLNDLKILIEYLQLKYGTVPLFLFGHSLGGLIIIRYGQKYSHQAKGFILSSPAVGLRFQIPSLCKKILDFFSFVSPNLSVQPSKWAGILKKVRQLEPYFQDESNPENMTDPFFTLEYTPRWLKELLHQGFHAISEAPAFRFPTLCLYDQQDPIVHPDSIQQFLDSLTIPDKKCVIFEKGLHRPWHADHCYEALNNVISWLNSRV